MVSECDLDIQDIFWKDRCQLIILWFWDIYWFIWRMNARGQRALARRNRREAAEVVQKGRNRGIGHWGGPFRIPGALARGPPAAAMPAPIDPESGMRLIVEVESMKKFILDYKQYSQKCPRQLLRKMQQFILEEQLDVICDEDSRDDEEIVE